MDTENVHDVISRAVHMGVSKEHLKRAAASLMIPPSNSDKERGGSEEARKKRDGLRPRATSAPPLSRKLSRLESLHDDQYALSTSFDGDQKKKETSAKVAPANGGWAGMRPRG